MTATLTRLHQEITREERIVGIPTDRPLTTHAIVRRHAQLGVLLGLLSLLTVATLMSAASFLRFGTAAIALAFGAYALQKERHLRRLTSLHNDECTIHLTVADSLLRSGVLQADRELLDLRTAVERCANRLAADLTEVVPADCAALRLVGPSGESPIAALCDVGEKGFRLDAAAAHDAIRTHAPVRRGGCDGRTILAVPIEHHHDLVGVLEVVSRRAGSYSVHDVELVSAFARGAVSGLLSGRWMADVS